MRRSLAKTTTLSPFIDFMKGRDMLGKTCPPASPIKGNQMNFSFKPVLIGWVTLLCQVPLQIFLTIWSGGFFGGMSMAAGLFPKNSHDPFIIFGSLAFIACPLILYFGKKWNYDQTECRFFEDRIEFEEGFFTINKKVIKYRDIKETTLRKGVFQRL